MKLSVVSVKLGDPGVASVILGQSPPSSLYNEIGEGVPFFQGKADFQRLHPTPRVWCTGSRRFAEPGDILIAVRAPVGDVNIATDHCGIGRGLAAVRPSRDSDPWFLYFALLYSKPTLEAMATGSTFASVNGNTLNDLDIPFFDGLEQAAIGRFLRSFVNQVEQEDEILRTAQALKRAAMRTLFTRGLRGEPRKETEIGPVPVSWEVSPLGELCVTTDSVDIRSEGDRTIHYVDVSSVSRDYLRIEATSPYILRDAPGRARKRILTGDVIFATVRPTLLRAAVVPEGLDNQVSSTAFCVLRRDRKMTTHNFIYYLVQRDQFVQQLAEVETGASYPAVTDRMVKEQIVPVPPLDEQQEIAAILDAIDRKIDLHRRKRAVLEELFKSLLHKLMTGEIRVGELDLSGIKVN